MNVMVGGDYKNGGNRMKVLKTGIIVWTLVLLSWGYTDAVAEEIAIISNKDYPSNTITLVKVKEIYLGEKLSDGYLKIKAFENNGESIKKKFIGEVMGITMDEYRAYWIKKFFREGVTPPFTKASSSDVIQAVSQTSGGIGYVWAEEVSSDVKVLLKIDAGD